MLASFYTCKCFSPTATNDGNVTLHNVTVSDAPALTGFSCTPSVLALGLLIPALVQTNAPAADEGITAVTVDLD